MCKGHIIIYLSTIIKKQTSLLIMALMFVFCVNLWGCGTEGTAGTDTAVNSVTTGTDTGVNSVTSGADAIAGTEGAAIMGTVAGTEEGECGQNRGCTASRFRRQILFHCSFHGIDRLFLIIPLCFLRKTCYS